MIGQEECALKSLGNFSFVCYMIISIDILIDEKLKPWLIEINKGPSFVCGSDLDTRIKSGVIKDALNLINVSE